MSKPKPGADAERLHKAAVERLAQQHAALPPPTTDGVTDQAIRQLHELQVHQVELAMQNESLQRARDDAEDTMQRLADLPIYATHPLVRRASSLQLAADAQHRLGRQVDIGLERRAAVGAGRSMAEVCRVIRGCG